MLGSMSRCVIERSQLRACDIIIANSTRSEIWKLPSCGMMNHLE